MLEQAAARQPALGEVVERHGAEEKADVGHGEREVVDALPVGKGLVERRAKLDKVGGEKLGLRLLFEQPAETKAVDEAPKDAVPYFFLMLGDSFVFFFFFFP